MTRKQIIEILNKELWISEEYDPRKDKSQHFIEGINKVADAILALPIDAPSEEEIEEFIISHPDNTGNFILGAGISAGFKVGAKWAINEILKRNGKE